MADSKIFVPFVRELEAALRESLSRHRQAAQQGDVEAMDLEVGRQKSLINARNQLEVLQELWPTLLAQEGDAEPPDDDAPPAGRRTPWQAFVTPILEVLEDLGGSGTAGAVIDRLERRMAGTLNDHDRDAFPSGGVRWRTTAQNARRKMIEEGLLASGSQTGTWDITEKGLEQLRRHR